MPAHPLSIQFLRFGLIGVVNTAIDFGILNLLMLMLDRPGGIVLMGCNAVAFLGGNFNSYLGNRYWTFAGNRVASVKEFSFFLTIAFAGLLINSSVLWSLTGGTPATFLQLNMAKIFATAVSMGWNFLGYRILLTR